MSSTLRVLALPVSLIVCILHAPEAASQVAKKQPAGVDGPKQAIPGSNGFTPEFNEPPIKKLSKQQPKFPKFDIPGAGGPLADAMEMARTPVIGLTEINELAAAGRVIDQLLVSLPAKVALLPVAAADPEANDPAASLPPAEMATEWLDQRTLRLYEQHRFVERLGAFDPTIQQQAKEIAELKAALALPKNPGMGYADRANSIRLSLTRMFVPHRYLARSFVNGTPAPIGQFMCCPVKEHGVKILLSGKGEKPNALSPLKAPSAKAMKCGAQPPLFADYLKPAESQECGKALEQFTTTVPTFDPNWDQSLPMLVAMYSASLVKLQPAAAAALVRFTTSVAAHDQAVVDERGRATSALAGQDAHLLRARAKLDDYAKTLADSQSALATVNESFAKAKAASAALEARAQTIQANHAAAVKLADAASKVAEASEAAATSPKEPVIAACNGAWKPDCSANVAEQRKTNEAQQAYFTKLGDLTRRSVADRLLAMTKLQDIMATSMEQIDVQTELAKQRFSEAALQKQVYAAKLKRDQDDAVLEAYRKLFDAAAARGEAVRARINSLAERRELILKAGPDDPR